VKLRLFVSASLSVLFVLCALVQAFAAPDAPKQFDPKLFQELRWRLIGPPRGGRVLAVTGVRGQPELFFFGSVGGGVWETNDAGRTWNPIFDSQAIASIGAIAVAPSDANVIYVGSGEADMRSSISLRQWDVQVHRRRQDVETHRAGGFAANRADHRGPAGREQGFRGGAGSRLRAERGARRFPFERWRKELAKDSVSRRKHGSHRFGFRARQSESDLRVAMADAKAAVEHLSPLKWSGQRALSLQ